MSSNHAGRTRGTLACVALLPSSLVGFWLVNATGFPRHFAHWLLGPEQRPLGGSAPPYLEWDIATMLFLLAVCGLASVILLARLVRKVRAHQPR